MSFSQNNVFSFIKENDNTILLDLSKEDLQLLLILIDDYKLSLRKKLELKNNITFGMEIEIDKIDSNRMEELEKSLPNDEWKIVNDLSIPNGKEIRTAPLKDTEKNWQDLDRICKILSNIGTITDKCGGHIHLGTQILDDDIKAWKNLFLIWSAYENIIYRFGNGEYLNGRSGITRYAEPIAKSLEKEYLEINKYNFDVRTALMTVKFFGDSAINFQHIPYDDYSHYEFMNTVEVRSPNSSDKAVIWQNNTNFFTKLFDYCNSKDFDYETIYKRIIKNWKKQKYLLNKEGIL